MDLRDLGFTSTSMDPDGALGGDVQMIVRVPKGTKAAYVGHVSEEKEEMELLLPRDVDTFRIVEVRYDGKLVVDALRSKDLNK